MNAIIASYTEYIELFANTIYDKTLTSLKFRTSKTPTHFSFPYQYTWLNTVTSEFRVIHNSSIAVYYITKAQVYCLHKYVHVFQFILYYEAKVLNSEYKLRIEIALV